MESKRYSYFRLDMNFMNDYRIRNLSRSVWGCCVLVFYLKLIALTLDTCGVLSLDRYPVKTTYALATETGTSRLIALAAAKKLMKLRLINVQEDGSVLLPEIADMIGSETYAAARMRRMRKRNALKRAEQENKACCSALRAKVQSVTIDIDKEPDTDTHKDIEREPDVDPRYTFT